MSSVSLKGGQVLTPAGTFEPGDIAIAAGQIVERAGGDAVEIDCRGLHILPGIVDAHGDAFESVLSPRPGVGMDFAIAMKSVDRQLLAHGITTAYHLSLIHI